MDQVLKLDRSRNPRQRANIFSTCTFAYIYPMFIKGFRKTLNEEDMPTVLDDHTSSKLGDKLFQYWKAEELYKHPSLWRALARTFGVEYMLIGIAQFFDQICLRLARALAISALLSSFTETIDLPNKISYVYIYAGVIVATSFFSIFIYQQTSAQIKFLALKARTACGSLIYRKALKLSQHSRQKITTGHLTNLLSNDIRRFELALVSAHYLWIAPIEVCLIILILFHMLGFASIVGIFLIIAVIPLQVIVGSKFSKYRQSVASRSDERIKLMSEIIKGIDVIKMYAWEEPFAKLVARIRRLEVQGIRTQNFIRGIMSFLTISIRVAILLSILAYVFTGNTITSFYVFTVTSVYQNMRFSVTIHFSLAITNVSEVKVSVKRIQDLLLSEEKPTNSIDKSVTVFKTTEDLRNKETLVELIDVSAKWDRYSVNPTISNVCMTAEPNQLIGITGPVGSGKTSILNTILNELYVDCGNVNVQGKLSYAPQEPWVFTGNIQQNIIFGLPMETDRYTSILKACALEHDLSLFPYGDKTLVGERGIILSGGQRARISLARAVYREADIYLLDDPFSAVDMHVGKHIFEQCIKKFLTDKCIILVTHQLQYLKAFDYIYVLDKGRVTTSGTYNEIKMVASEFLQESKELQNIPQQTVRSMCTAMDKSPDINKEHRNTGAISTFVYASYLKAGGSPIKFAIAFLVFVLTSVSLTATDYFPGYWINQEQKTLDKYGDTPLKDIWFYPYIQLGIVLVFATLTFLKSFLFYSVTAQVSMGIHDRTFSNTLGTSLNFYHRNYSGRILNRFSKDMGIIDESIPSVIDQVLSILLLAIGSVVIISTTNPWLLICASVAIALFYFIISVYTATSQDILRLDGTATSPIFGHINETMQGLTTIRAFNSELMLQKEFDGHQDWNSSVISCFIPCSKALELWIEIVCTLFISSVIFETIFFQTPQYNGNVGLAITQAIGLLNVVNWGLVQLTLLENQMTSFERVLEYTELKSEENDGSSTIPTSTWPQLGSIRFSSTSLRYGSNEPFVLKNVDLYIGEKQRIGIVGRTGAGKSSLITALFQLYSIEGKIVIDNIDITKIPLKVLRQRISIIPQNPTLFSGTVRSNLDPFSSYSDDELWTVLENVELKSVISKLPSGLDDIVCEGGTNFSVGQKQLLCLARAILRRNKIIILDEATANIDSDTDQLIQSTIRKNFVNCTVITIAHRINTIVDSDKVLVLEDGNVVEYDHPYKLLQNQEGRFYLMTLQSGMNMVNVISTTAPRGPI